MNDRLIGSLIFTFDVIAACRPIPSRFEPAEANHFPALQYHYVPLFSLHVSQSGAISTSAGVIPLLSGAALSHTRLNNGSNPIQFPAQGRGNIEAAKATIISSQRVGGKTDRLWVNIIYILC